MSAPIISVENLSKRYLVGHRVDRGGPYTYTALRDVLGQEFRNFGRKAFDVVRGREVVQGDAVEEYWALRHVSFEVQQGEMLGVIGRNGAGKSTLLKILSRITEPASGRVTLRGRVASLLEVGTGFHPELSGRENIYLNGAILGMTRAEIRKKFDEIVAFAEVEAFLDTPVKRYSSGMYVRLAFAVAAHLEPEILIIDEVLAVGDAEFQRKCLGKMDEVARREGRTILFVSHNMVAVRSLCKRALLLANGRLTEDAPVEQTITRYLNTAQDPENVARWPDDATAPGTDTVRVRRIEVVAHHGSNMILTMQTTLGVNLEYCVIGPGRPTHFTFVLVNEYEIIVLTTWGQAEASAGYYQTGCEIPGNLLNSGKYYLRLLIVENGNVVVYDRQRVVSFTIEDTASRGPGWLGREPGVIQPPLKWSSNRCRGELDGASCEVECEQSQDVSQRTPEVT